MRRVLVRLGEDVTYTPSGGGSSTVRGMFLEPYQSASLGDVALLGSSDPQFAGMRADMPAVARGDTLARGAVTYTVRNVEPDQVSGLTVLQLQAPP